MVVHELWVKGHVQRKLRLSASEDHARSRNAAARVQVLQDSRVRIGKLVARPKQADGWLPVPWVQRGLPHERAHAQDPLLEAHLKGKVEVLDGKAAIECTYRRQVVLRLAIVQQIPPLATI